MATKTVLKKTTKKIPISLEQKKVSVRNKLKKIGLEPEKLKVEIKTPKTKKIFVDLTGQVSTDYVFSCTSSEQVGDVVFIDGSGNAVKASNSGISVARAIGFIISKSSTTSCKVRFSGVVSSSGLSIGQDYFLGTSGQITTAPPVGSGKVLVRVGQAISSSLFLIKINNDYVIRS